MKLEPVWIVTTLGPTRANDGCVMIPAPLAPAGSHGWATSRPNYAASEPRLEREDELDLGDMLEHLRDGPAPTWSPEPPSDAERAFMELLRDRPW